MSKSGKKMATTVNSVSTLTKRPKAEMSLTKEDFIGMLREELQFIEEEQLRLYDRKFAIREMLEEDLNEKA